MGQPIGLALSGGGFRAAGFHLGVLARLADEGLLEDVTALSTVSGGSLAISLVMTAGGGVPRWPTSEEYRRVVVPHARRMLTTTDLQGSYIRRLLRDPLSLLRPRARVLAALLAKLWGVTAPLSALPERPVWLINATCYETGVNWRFSARQMGDYCFGYSADTAGVPLSEAVAASGAFPGVIGPLTLHTERFTWTPPAGGQSHPLPIRTLHLWDGGVYDNLGTEGLFNPGSGYRQHIKFLIVSDAGARPGIGDSYNPFIAPYRIISLATNQVRSLRARMIVAHLKDSGAGGYFQIDNSASYLLTRAGRKEEIPALAPRYLSEEDVRRAALMETAIKQLQPDQFELLFRHGFEVADMTLYGVRSGGRRPLRGYRAAEWA